MSRALLRDVPLFDAPWRVAYSGDPFGERFVTYRSSGGDLRVQDRATGETFGLPAELPGPCRLLGRHLYFANAHTFVDVFTWSIYRLPDVYQNCQIRLSMHSNHAGILYSQSTKRSIIFTVSNPPAIVDVPDRYAGWGVMSWGPDSITLTNHLSNSLRFVRITMRGRMEEFSYPHLLEPDFRSKGAYWHTISSDGDLSVRCALWASPQTVPGADFRRGWFDLRRFVYVDLPTVVSIIPGKPFWRVRVEGGGPRTLWFVDLLGWAEGQRHLFAPGVRRLAALLGALGLRGVTGAAYQGWLETF